MKSESGKQIRIHAIGYGHLDPIWLWDWREGCRENLATVRSAILKMKEYDEMKMSSSSAQLYFWVKMYDAEFYNLLKRQVLNGRWEIIGGWWIEPDVNLPSGESLIRQGFYGKRFFHKNFGTDCIIGFNPDTFGHPGTLPKILKHLGQFYYVFMRPDAAEKELPNDVFIWEADDGTQILCSRIQEGYDCNHNIEQKVEKLISITQDNEYLSDALCFYGEGDHGGGPSNATIEALLRLKAEMKDHKIVFGTLLQYFMQLEPFRQQLPVVHDELQHHARGCYSVHTDFKRLNRRCEQALLTTEKWCTISTLILNNLYPQVELKHAWQNVLLHQFHDVITGTSLRKGMQDATMYLNETLATCDRELYMALQQLTSHILIEEAQGEFIIFNPLPWRNKIPIEIEYVSNPDKPLEFIDSNEQSFTVQHIQRAELTSASRSRWIFFDTLPALGYQTYRWREMREPAASESIPLPLKIDENRLENQFWRVEFDPETGFLTRLFDKILMVEVVNQSAAIARVFEDQSDTWSHEVTRYDEFLDDFKQPEFAINEVGPVRAALCIKTHFNNSTFEQKWLLYRDDPRIEIQIDLNWQEQQKLVKYCFPLAPNEQTCFSEQPYGQIRREADGEEHPFQQWLDISGTVVNQGRKKLDYGVTFLNNGIYSYSLAAGELQMTLCRSAIYAHHDPVKPDPNKHYDYSDQGRHEVTFVICPHLEKTPPPYTIQQAHALNAPPYVFIDYPHSGYLPKENSFMEIMAPNVIGTVIKNAEDGDEFILRCFEVKGEETTTVLRLPYWKLESEFTIKPHAINTYRIKISGGIMKLIESNGLEE